ncbi:MAG: hypothetical protein WKG07_26465 [Hymenobacter sp.]
MVQPLPVAGAGSETAELARRPSPSAGAATGSTAAGAGLQPLITGPGGALVAGRAQAFRPGHGGSVGSA